MKQAGVYTILNLVTGRCYVGSSNNVPRRWQDHLSALTRGVHPLDALQADWTRYGAASFSWTLTEACVTRDDAIRAEQTHIDANPNLYNAARRAGSGPRDGFKHSDISRQKMSAALKGQRKSAAHRAKLSAAKAGKSCPAQSAALKGRHHSPDHCEKIRLGNTGKVRTDEMNAAMRDRMTGRVITWGAKVSAGKRGKPWSAKRRAALETAQANVEQYAAMRAKMSHRMSESHRGVPWSALRRERWNAKHGVPPVV